MLQLALILCTGIALFMGYQWQQKQVAGKRERLIDSYTFPSGLARKLAAKHPKLGVDDINRVIRGLREYFHICNLAGKTMVAMPSQVVDEAWHEFILFSREYQFFCNKALGRFIHHTPAEAMKSSTAAQAAIKRAWRLACYREKIHPRFPAKLPLLFALDAQLNILNGFTYSLNCSDKNGVADSGPVAYCAGHIGCATGCGGDSGVSGDGGGGCGGGD